MPPRAASRRSLQDDRGTVAVIFAVMLTGVFGITGLAITFVAASHEKSAHQAALDAAVLAGANASPGATNDQRLIIAKASFDANLKKSGFVAASSTEFSSTTSAPVFSVVDETVTGTATVAVKNYFSGFVGSSTLPLSLRSAARVSGSDPVCVLALDSSSPQAVEIYGTAQFTARNCAVQANSTDGSGMRQYGSATGRARRFGVNGGYSGSGFTPLPITGVPPTADPYASIPFPATGPCVDIASKLQNTPAVLEPGTYCGGIRIMANSQIIMQPGVYVMLDGPFRIDSQSTVRGTDVVIAFKGFDTSLYLGSGADVQLTSPSSGTYMNIQFLQDKNSSPDRWVTMMGDIKLSFDGVMYFPTQHIWIGGGSIISARSPTYIVVAKKLWFQDNSVTDVWQENARNLSVPETQVSIEASASLTE